MGAQMLIATIGIGLLSSIFLVGARCIWRGIVELRCRRRARRDKRLGRGCQVGGSMGVDARQAAAPSRLGGSGGAWADRAGAAGPLLCPSQLWLTTVGAVPAG